MSNFSVARSALKTNESREISRTTLRTLDGPWVRTPLRSMEETFAGSLGNLAGRAAGAVFNTQGHKLRQAAKARSFRDQMRQHYSDSPGAMQHLGKEFEKQSADQAQKATHGRFSRFFFGDPSKRGDGEAHNAPPQTTTIHHTPAPALDRINPSDIARMKGANAPAKAEPSARKVSLTPAMHQRLTGKPMPTTSRPSPGETPDQAKSRWKDFVSKTGKPATVASGATASPVKRPDVNVPARKPAVTATAPTKRPDVNVPPKTPSGPTKRPDIDVKKPASVSASIKKLKDKRARVLTAAQPKTPAKNATAKAKPVIVPPKVKK